MLREFWRLFATAVQDGIFTGGDGNKIIRHDAVALKASSNSLICCLVKIGSGMHDTCILDSGTKHKSFCITRLNVMHIMNCFNL